MTPLLTHGDLSTPLFIGAEIVENLEGLDTATLKYSASNRHYFGKGQQIEDSEYAGLFIENVRSTKDGDVWDLTLDCLGVAGPKAERHLKGSPDITYSPNDWDTAKIEMLTTNPTRFIEGQLIGGYGQAMVCMSANPKPLDTHSGWYRFNAQLKGIARNKAGSRQITATGRTISGDSITWPLEPGWTTARAGEVTISQVTVVDTLFSTNAPDTANTPGNRIPPAAPPIRLFNVTVTDPRTYWPNGWSFVPAGEQLVAGVSLWKITNTYTWVAKFLPK